MEKVRESNFEILRILAIFCVFSHHFLLHTFKEFDIAQNALNSFFIIGVDIFIILSGWFQIKFSIKKLLYLYLTCILCGLFSQGINVLIDGISPTELKILNKLYCTLLLLIFGIFLTI